MVAPCKVDVALPPIGATLRSLCHFARPGALRAPTSDTSDELSGFRKVALYSTRKFDKTKGFVGAGLLNKSSVTLLA